MRSPRKLFSVVVGAVTVGLLISSVALAGGGAAGFRRDTICKTRGTRTRNPKINAGNVANLAVKWQFTTGGDVSATPAVDGYTVYFPDWAGNLFAINQTTGTQSGRLRFLTIPDITGDFSWHNASRLQRQPAHLWRSGRQIWRRRWMLAVNKQTGNLVWKTQVESVRTFPVITQSAWSMASYLQSPTWESLPLRRLLEAFIPGYICCSFRGSMLALNANTGRFLWKTYTMPAGGHAAIVIPVVQSGSTPAIDHQRNSVYIGAGNNYRCRLSVQNCVAAANNDPAAAQACISPDDHFNSVMALDLKTGAINGLPSRFRLTPSTRSFVSPGDPKKLPAAGGPRTTLARVPRSLR